MLYRMSLRCYCCVSAEAAVYFYNVSYKSLGFLPILILGYLTSFIEMGNLAGLRTFRVLRALKTVAILPSKSSHTRKFAHNDNFINADIICMYIYSNKCSKVVLSMYFNICIFKNSK